MVKLRDDEEERGVKGALNKMRSSIPQQAMQQPQPEEEEMKAVVQKAIVENPDLKEKDKKKVLTNLADPKKQEKAIAREEKGKGSVSDQFTQALTFFAPQIIGGLGGAMFEGTEGAIAGMEAGGQARDAYLNYEMKREALDAKKQPAQSKIDITPDFQVKGTNLPVFSRTNPESGLPEFIDDQGNIIPSTQVESLKSADDRLRQASIGGRHAANLEFNKAKASEFSGKQQEVQSGFDNTRESLSAIDQLFSIRDPQTGVVTGRYNDLAAMAGIAPENYVRLRTETRMSIAAFLKTTSGATVSEQERQFLRTIIPTTVDNPKEFQDKLRQFREIVIRAQRKELMSIMQTQPLKRQTASAKLQLLNDAEMPEAIENKIGPTNPNSPNTGSAMERVNAMDEEKRKRYEAFKARRK